MRLTDYSENWPFSKEYLIKIKLSANYFFRNKSLSELKKLHKDPKTSPALKEDIELLREQIKRIKKSVKETFNNFYYPKDNSYKRTLVLFWFLLALEKSGVKVTDPEMIKKLKKIEKEREKYIKIYFNKKDYKKWKQEYLHPKKEFSERLI